MTSHRHRPAGKPLFVAALAVTLCYACVELAGGLWAGSLALIGDAGHMFSDALALGLAAGAARLARRPVGERHSYGWARAEVIGALLNGLLMLPVVAVLAVEAVRRLIFPHPVAGGSVLVIAFFGLLLNAVVAVILSRAAHNLNARAALLHVLGDLVSSVAALIAGAIIYATGWFLIDPILTLLIAGLILATTLKLLRDTLHVLMEGVPAEVGFSETGNALAALPGVVSVHDLHVWSIAPDSVALSAHLEIEALAEWPSILDRSRTMLHDRFGIDHVTLQPEVTGSAVPQKEVVRLWPQGRRPQH